jgi:hypothetical protein
MKPTQSDPKDDEAFLRTIVFSEEERRLFTTAPWSGGFRWFRSTNVVPLEKYREMKRKGHTMADHSPTLANR